MNTICDLESCTGCMACYSVCQNNAIDMRADERGFLYPQICAEKCIECKRCIEVCPVNRKVDYVPDIQEVYACWQKDKDIREQSTSGGLFSVLAEFVLERDGAVFGARFDDTFKVIHSYTENKDDLTYFRGSKYVQSHIGGSFKQAEYFLKQGKMVLFTGTPCQISGLKSFLGRNYANLLCVDIVCHGVPSPMVFMDYLEYIRQSIAKDITGIRFRYKKPSWTVFSMKIDFQEHPSYIKDTNTDPFIIGFLDDFLTRTCCSKCNYANINRCSDITLGDFWGYISEREKFRNTEEGISLVLVNTNKGKTIFEQINDKLVIVEKSIEEAKKGNQCLSRPFSKNIQEQQFWKEYIVSRDFAGLADKYFVKKKIKYRRRISLYFNDHAYYLTKSQRKLILGLKEKLKGFKK